MEKGTVEWDVEFGLHSNIPECCVNAFVRDTLSGIEHIALHRRSQYPSENNRPSAHYVRCADCIISDRVQELHVCSRENEECMFFIKFIEEYSGCRFPTEGDQKYECYTDSKGRYLPEHQDKIGVP